MTAQKNKKLRDLEVTLKSFDNRIWENYETEIGSVEGNRISLLKWVSMKWKFRRDTQKDRCPTDFDENVTDMLWSSEDI